MEWRRAIGLAKALAAAGEGFEPSAPKKEHLLSRQTRSATPASRLWSDYIMKKNKTQDRPKIALALGSGGAKGLAHIGVLKIFDKYKIPIDFLAGSSMGALVGGLYAYFGQGSAKKIEKNFIKANWKTILDLFIDPSLKGGLIKGEKVKDFLEAILKNADFKNLKIPFLATATDLLTAKPIVLNSGSLNEAIRASISIPLLFSPVKKGQTILADGGMSFPVPVLPLFDFQPDIIIGVNLYEDYHKISPEKFSFTSIGMGSLNIVLHNLANCNLKNADFIIAPKVGKIGWGDFLKIKEAISLGEKAALRLLPSLKKVLE